MAHIRRSRPDSGLGVEVEGRETFNVVPLPRDELTAPRLLVPGQYAGKAF